jgi:hypothetical protein
MAPRIWKISGFTLLALFCIVTNSCSAVNVPPVDVKGYGLIKWGMTPEQVKALLGPKAQILTDPHSSAAIATVRLMVGDRELSGYVSTDLHTQRVNGVHLIYQGQNPSHQQMFSTLMDLVSKQYGAPSKDLLVPSARNCQWGFASGDILLISSTGNDAQGFTSLSYLENPSGFSHQKPFQN